MPSWGLPSDEVRRSFDSSDVPKRRSTACILLFHQWRIRTSNPVEWRKGNWMRYLVCVWSSQLHINITFHSKLCKHITNVSIIVYVNKNFSCRVKFHKLRSDSSYVISFYENVIRTVLCYVFGISTWSPAPISSSERLTCTPSAIFGLCSSKQLMRLQVL